MKTTKLFGILIATVLVSSTVWALPEDPVIIPDAGLRSIIQDALGITDGRDPTEAEMATLSGFGAGGKGISDLTGIEYAVNVTGLGLKDNEISDLGPLSGLINLNTLDLRDNQISNVTPLSGLENLWSLNLSLNQITDISPLDGLTNLWSLGLEKNQISDISPLSSLTNLGNISLSANLINNFDPLTDLTNLVSIKLSDLSDLSPISGLTTLTTLAVNGLQTADLNLLSGLINLDHLSLTFCGISDISALSNLDMTKLLDLNLADNSISNISVVSGMTNLIGLNVNKNQISDISALSELMYLKRLDLRNNPLNSDACTTYIPQIIVNNPGITLLQNICPDPGSLLINGGFESGSKSPWKTGTTPPAVITSGVVQELTGASVPEDPIEGNYCLHVEVSNTTSNWWLTGVFYDGLVFQAGKRYTLSAFLKCKQGTLQFDLAPHLSVDPWTGYGQKQFTMTDQWAEYSVTTPVFASDVSPAQVTFHVGFAPGEFWMDNIRLVEEDAPPDMVYFADQNFKQAVIDALAGIGIYTYDPTESQMSNLTQIYANNRGISDLTGIEYAVNLTLLAANDNQISILDPLSGLTNLTNLEMRNNLISDLSPLSGLTNLTTLNLRGNQISDVSLLAALTNLTTLVLQANQISNLNPLSGLTNLTKLRLWSNQITDISPLSGLTNLTLLTLGQNQISDISALAGMTNLTELGLPSNQISDISPLLGHSNLTILRLQVNQINNIGAISGLTNLTELNLSTNLISDITPLAGMTQMESLRLKSNQISDVSALAGMTNLTLLHLIDNQISDISALVNSTNMVELNFERNQIADISSLANMTNLQILICNYNNVSDLEPLTGMTTLTRLWLLGCPLSQDSCYIWIPTIRINNPGIDLPYDAYSNNSLQMWFDAEGGSVGLPMEILNDVTAFGGQYIALPTVGTNSANWPPPDGHVTYSFSVPTGTYMVWGRINALSGEDDSFWARIEGASTNTSNHPSGWIQWWGIKKGTDWFWNPIQSHDDGNTYVQFTLSEGSYTLEIAYREDGTKLDHLLITDYLNLTADEISGITPTGSNTEVAPIDSQTGATPVTLSFENITESGETSLTTSTTGPPVPTGFQLLDTYYDIDTTATFTGMVQIEIEYDDSGLTLEEELLLKLWHYDETLQEWIDATTGIDTTNNIIYGETDHLSPFIISVNIVGIDIKPGSYPNSFNLNGNGLIPVAIFGSAGFDVTKIDVSTLSMAGLEVRVKPNGTPQCSVEDVSGKEGMPDGYPDLVCQFVDNPDNWLLGETENAIVTGYLKQEFGGVFIEGSDEIRIVP